MATAQRTDTGSTMGNLARSPSLPVMLTIAAMVIGLAALLPLVQNSGATTTAGKITQLEQQQTAEQAKLRELELNVATLGSLDRIEHEAKTRLQMETPKQVRYLAVDTPPPEQRKLPSRFLPEAHKPAQAGSSFWKSLFGRLIP